MKATHPVGYGTRLVTLDHLFEIHGTRMEPEFRRRLYHWLAQNPNIGIGGGWRRNPHSVSAASRAGRSFHQTQRFADGFQGYAAVDLVVAQPGRRHRAPYWSEVPKQGSRAAVECGIWANVSSETWHVQALPMDGFGTWDRNGRQNPQPNYPIVGAPAPEPAPAPAPDAGNPLAVIRARLDQIAAEVRTNPVVQGERSDRVFWLQKLVSEHGFPTKADSDFGPATAQVVKDFQASQNLKVDGIVGPRTWSKIDQPVAHPPEHKPPRVYIVAAGDSWWQIAAKQLGDGRRWTEIAHLNGGASTTLHPGAQVKLP